jgi:hypothetical protein
VLSRQLCGRSNISLQRAVNDKVLTSSVGGRSAELGRYISVLLRRSVGLAHLS